MQAVLIKLFQMSSGPMTLTVTFALKIAILNFKKIT